MQDLEGFIKTIAIYGSYAKYDVKKISDDRFTFDHDPESDIDVLVVVDDVKYSVTAEFVNSYRIRCATILRDLNFKVHLQTIKLSNFWDMARKGHPILVNILRTGYPLFDVGMFESMQYLLEDGKIKGSEEMVNEFYKKSSAALHNSRVKVMRATLDLYWGVYDSAQAALMHVGEMPGMPQLIPDLLQMRFDLPAKIPHFFRQMYDIAKNIEQGKIEFISGDDFEKMRVEAQAFQEQMRKLIYGNT